MKTNTSIVKNLGAAALVFTLTNNGASAAEVDAQIATASAAVQQALAENTIDNMLEHKSHHKHHHEHQLLAKGPKFISQVPASPAAANLAKVDNSAVSSHATLVDVPIDEVQAINLSVNALYGLDTIESVTLKSFRKVVGYDTFNSILNGAREETKDMSDHYNITMTVMVKRDPEEAHTPPPAETFDGGKTLSKIIDKGFPYDDGDNSIEDQTPKWSKKKTETPINVGKLNGENVTKQALVALVKDTDAPITQGLVQLDEMKSDADGLFKLMDANVTRGNLKNLVTDKPSPITVGLAQKSDADGLFKLMDANVTRGNLKNLVTDKPSPITVGLAQKSDADGLFKLMDANVTRGNLKNLVTDKPSPITVGLAQKSDADGLFKLMDANVTRGNLKNLVTDKPSPITVGLAQTSDNSLAQGVPVHVNPVLARDTMGDAKLDMKILVGPDDVELKKKAKK
jgi:hypothetical protein